MGGERPRLRHWLLAAGMLALLMLVVPVVAGLT